MKRELDDQDKTKLHFEILQLCQQRFLLCIAAVAFFGAITAKLIPDKFDAVGLADITRACIGSLILTVVLLVLFVQSHLLRKVLRTYSSYLIATESSKWEEDWKSFRIKYGPLAGYDTMAHTYIFLGLGVLSALYPVLLALAAGQGFHPVGWLLTALGGGVAYIALGLCMGFGAWHHSEGDIEGRWKAVIPDKT